MENMWNEATELYPMSIKEALEIIDDATVHGFEFMLSNGKLYFKEGADK